MTDPLKTAIKANGSNGQSIIDYFVGIKGDCNIEGSMWYLSPFSINYDSRNYQYALLDSNGKLNMFKELPQGYTLIDENQIK